MGAKAKAPKAPDYKALAEQQSKLQNEQLQAQTVANRPNQVGPMGSVQWQQDPTTGAWTQNTTLDPRVQELMDQQLQQIQSLSGSEFGGGPAMPTYDPASGQAYANTFTESLLSRLRPQQGIDQESMATKLRLQGLQPGTEAYDRAYRNLLTSQGDVNAQATLQGQMAGQQEARNIYQAQLAGQGQGYQQELQNYLLPWQTMGQSQNLVGGMANYTPQFQGFAASGMGQGTDVLGSAQQQYAQQMQQYNEKAASKQGKGQALGSIVGGVGGFMVGGPAGAMAGSQLGGAAGGSLASDVRLKEDINTLSDEQCYEQMKKMLPISWRWSGTSVLDEGISAQQVLELAPELVNRGEHGLLKVNYTALFARLLGAFRHMAKIQEPAHDHS